MLVVQKSIFIRLAVALMNDIFHKSCVAVFGIFWNIGMFDRNCETYEEYQKYQVWLEFHFGNKNLCTKHNFAVQRVFNNFLPDPLMRNFTVGCETQLEIFALYKLFPFLIYFQTVFMMNFFVIFDDSSELNLNCTCCSRCCCHCCCRCCFRNIFFKFFKTFISWSWRDKDIGTYNFVFLKKHCNVP